VIPNWVGIPQVTAREDVNAGKLASRGSHRPEET